MYKDVAALVRTMLVAAPDLTITVVPTYQVQHTLQYEACALASVIAGWHLRGLRPLTDLGLSQQRGRPRNKWFSVRSSIHYD